MTQPDPQFPPLLTGHALAPGIMPFEEACAGAAAGRLGAGDVLWSRDVTRASLAIVLEPEVGPAASRQMLPLMMVAVGDCLGALMPPQVAVHFRWPDRLLVNGAEAGSFQLAIADGAGESTANTAASSTQGDTLPPWMVIGCDIRLMMPLEKTEPGDVAHLTALVEEGGADLDSLALIQSLSAHFLTWVNIWQEDGFRPVHDSWLPRAEGDGAIVTVACGGERVAGTIVGLDEAAGLAIRLAQGGTRILPLEQALSDIPSDNGRPSAAASP
jgi:BirA family biotin operon repressor/biotin-[acetyl-CoA-carboxylase] ligase